MADHEDYEDDMEPQDWLNTGGTHYHHGSNPQTVKRGQVLKQVPRSEIRNFLDKFQPVMVRTKQKVAIKESFVLKSHPGGWYDVVNVATGKAINDKKLRRSAAEALINEE